MDLLKQEFKVRVCKYKQHCDIFARVISIFKVLFAFHILPSYGEQFRLLIALANCYIEREVK